MKEQELDLNSRVDLVLKASLDFNSSVLIIHANFSGNMRDRRDFKKFKDNIERAEKAYREQVALILKEEQS